MFADDQPRSVSRIELVGVAAITTFAAWIRGRGLFELGLSHFDEGEYALSGLWPYTGGFEPNQAFFSPPIYPLLIGFANFALGGPSASASMLVSLLSGTLLVVVAWWFVRRNWSPIAGMIAAFLTAQDSLLALFSRTGLTDATFLLGFLTSLSLTWQSLRGGSKVVALAAGVAVGFTWNVKYSGFLAIPCSLGWMFWAGRLGKGWFSQTLQLTRISAIAMLFYAPWASWFHMKHEGGYRTLLAHQRGYWAGPDAIATNWDSYRNQASAIQTAHGGLVGPPIHSHPLPGWLLNSVLAAGILTAGWLSNTPLPAFPLAVVVSVALTGCYSYYLRLWLPVHLFLLVLLAAIFGSVLESGWRWMNRSYSGEDLKRLVVAFCLFAGLAPFAQCSFQLPAAVSNSGYRETARLLVAKYEEQRNQGAKRRLYGVVRPPLTFYLIQQGIPMQRLPDDARCLEAIPVGGWLLSDPAAADSPKFLAAFANAQASLAPQFKLVDRIPIDESLATRMDQAKGHLPDVSRQQSVVMVYERVGGAK